MSSTFRNAPVFWRNFASIPHFQVVFGEDLDQETRNEGPETVSEESERSETTGGSCTCQKCCLVM